MSKKTKRLVELMKEKNEKCFERKKFSVASSLTVSVASLN